MSTSFIILAITGTRYSLSDLNRYFLWKNQILSLTCLPISPNELFLNIPQFDILTIGAQVFGLLITLSSFYYFSVSIVIPNFIEVKKFRTKKIIKNTNFISSMNLDIINNKKLIINSYKLFMQ